MPDGVRKLFGNGAFRAHHLLGRVLGSSFALQNSVVTVLCGIAMVWASWTDDSWTLNGDALGLFEHPAIWGFLLFQAIVPVSIFRSLARLWAQEHRFQAVFNRDVTLSDEILPRAKAFSSGQTPLGRSVAAFVYGAGFAAWVWNTFQNQQPLSVLPFDFWDSASFRYGYLVTRLYKFYVFVLLIPRLVQITAGFVFSILDAIGEAIPVREVALLPFDPDRVGGFGFVPDLVTAPVIPTLLISAIPVAGAMTVHGSVAWSPSLGVISMMTALLSLWVVPASSLASYLGTLRDQALGDLGRTQHAILKRITSASEATAVEMDEARSALEYFNAVEDRIRGLSRVPHLRRVVIAIAVAWSPHVFAMIVDTLDRFAR